MRRIRPAQADDADGILAILNPIIAQTTITFAPDLLGREDVLAGLASHAERGDPYLVAAQGDQVLGFAKYGPFRGGEGYRRIAETTVHLAPSARGSGLGRQLVTALEVHAKAAGKHSLIAGISGENTQAIAFHAHLGFSEVGRIPQAGYKFGRYLDLVMMQKYV